MERYVACSGDRRKCPSNLIFLLCKLIEELASSDFPTPAAPVLCLFLSFISEFDGGRKQEKL